MRVPLRGRDRVVDAAGCLLAVGLGVLFLIPTLRAGELTMPRFAVDVGCGVLACVTLWWRRRWAVGVAVACLVLGTVSVSATPAGLLALLSLAVHRPARTALVVAALWVPSIVLFALYSPMTDAWSVLVRVTPFVLAVVAWGLFVRARRQLLGSLRERAVRAEADQRRHEDLARTAERARIAREMHDVLAHRLSLLAVHAGALEVRPDLPPAEVRQTAALLRSTAHQALEELRGVIGVLRAGTGPSDALSVPQPGLGDIRQLVQESRRAGVEVDFEMQVEAAAAAPGALGRDAYRIVQEALTNVRKHAAGATAEVRVTGSPATGLHVTVRNAPARPTPAGAVLPGSGAGLLGLQERAALAGGTLVHGTHDSDDFVVEAVLPWHR